MANIKKRNFLIKLGLTAALLIMIEVAARVALNKIYNRDFDASLIIDNKFLNSSGLKEKAHGIVWGKSFNTDSLGCRIAARPINKQKKKWLFIGDSVTEGVGVDDTSTFAYRVSAGVDSLDILNYSLIGYADADYLNILKTVLPKTDSSVDRVTIFFCLNDVYGKSTTRELPVMAKQNIGGMLNAPLQKYYATYKLLKLLAYQNSTSYYRYDRQFYEPRNSYFIGAMNILQQCDSVCSAAGAKLDVIMLPYRSQLSGKFENDRVPQELVDSFCESNNIRFTTPMLGHRHHGPVNKLYLFGDEIHLSEEGHKAIADYILSY